MCSCLIGYVGVPPSCRPECLVDSDCTSLKSCSNQKCIDPCLGTCGLNAECRIHYHKAICYCPNGYSGDPFTQCTVKVQGIYIKSFLENMKLFFNMTTSRNIKYVYLNVTHYNCLQMKYQPRKLHVYLHLVALTRYAKL